MNCAMMVWMEATLRKMKTKVTLQQCQVIPKQELVRKLLNRSFMHTPFASVTNRMLWNCNWQYFIGNIVSNQTKQLSITHFSCQDALHAGTNVAFLLPFYYFCRPKWKIYNFNFCFLVFLTHFNAFLQPHFFSNYHCLSTLPSETMDRGCTVSYYYYSLWPLCRVFIIAYLQQTMFLGYIVM